MKKGEIMQDSYTRKSFSFQTLSDEEIDEYLWNGRVYEVGVVNEAALRLTLSRAKKVSVEGYDEVALAMVLACFLFDRYH